MKYGPQALLGALAFSMFLQLPAEKAQAADFKPPRDTPICIDFTKQPVGDIPNWGNVQTELGALWYVYQTNSALKVVRKKLPSGKRYTGANLAKVPIGVFFIDNAGTLNYIDKLYVEYQSDNNKPLTLTLFDKNASEVKRLEFHSENPPRPQRFEYTHDNKTEVASVGDFFHQNGLVGVICVRATGPTGVSISSHLKKFL